MTEELGEEAVEAVDIEIVWESDFRVIMTLFQKCL